MPELSPCGQVVVSARYFLLDKVEHKPAASCCFAQIPPYPESDHQTVGGISDLSSFTF